LASFPDGADDGELRDAEGRNRLRICCPREGCGSLVLLEGAAAYVRRKGVRVRNFLSVRVLLFGDSHALCIICFA
jgi:hypothetical protein